MIRLECNLATYPPGDGLKDKTNLIVSTENINGIPISPISGAQLTLWSPPQIKLDATFQGDFLYLSFGPVNIVNSTNVNTLLTNSWIPDPRSNWDISASTILIGYLFSAKRVGARSYFSSCSTSSSSPEPVPVLVCS